MDVEQLINQARSGDRTALQQLLLKYSAELRNHIAHRLPSSLHSTLDAEDVVQEALCEAYLKIDRLQKSSAESFLAWIKAIGEMSLLMFMRAESAQKRGGQLQKRHQFRYSDTGSVIDLLEHLPEDVTTPSRAAANQEALTALQVAVAELPPDQREVIVLHLLQGKTVEATAE